jgi:hypothetical protein
MKRNSVAHSDPDAIEYSALTAMQMRTLRRQLYSLRQRLGEGL